MDPRVRRGFYNNHHPSRKMEPKNKIHEIPVDMVRYGKYHYHLQGFSTMPGGWEWDFNHLPHLWVGGILDCNLHLHALPPKSQHCHQPGSLQTHGTKPQCDALTLKLLAEISWGVFGNGLRFPYHPWDWYNYLHEWLIFMVNGGKYTIHGYYGAFSQTAKQKRTGTTNKHG